MKAVRKNDFAHCSYNPKFTLNEWYYLYIQLNKDKINMSIFNNERISVDKRTFDTPVGFSQFSIAFAHSLGPRTKEKYFFKTCVKSVIVADKIKGKIN